MTLAKTTKYAKVSLTELKALVEGAKNGEVDATERLCDQFKHLVYKEANNAYIKAKLGEDAINIAWIGFLEAIQKYNRKGVSAFPAYAREFIHYALLTEIRSLFSKNAPAQVSLDELQEKYLTAEAAYTTDVLALTDSQLDVDKLLNCLTDKQKLIITRLFINSETLEAIAHDLNTSITAVYNIKNRAIKKLSLYLHNGSKESSLVM